MKNTCKLIIPLAFCLLITSFMQAQRRGGSPEERAQKQTERMTEALTLSTAQTAKIQEINLKYSKLGKEARDKARQSDSVDREAMRESMMSLHEKKKAELKLVLTADQFTKYEQLEAERKEKRSNGRKGKGKKKEKEGDRS